MFAASCTRPISLTVVNTDPPLASSLIFWTIVGISASSALAADTARSEEHTSELQSLMRISYAVFCLKKKNRNIVYNRYDHTHQTHRNIAQHDVTAQTKH